MRNPFVHFAQTALLGGAVALGSAFYTSSSAHAFHGKAPDMETGQGPSFGGATDDHDSVVGVPELDPTNLGAGLALTAASLVLIRRVSCSGAEV